MDGAAGHSSHVMEAPNASQPPSGPAPKYRCVTLRAKQGKYQSQVSIQKSAEKLQLPSHMAKLTTLTGGFYANAIDAARASDKCVFRVSNMHALV